MQAVEDLGLLKMDFLGLKNLTIIEDTLRRIYKVRGKSLSISEIPFDDKKALKIFQEAKTTKARAIQPLPAVIPSDQCGVNTKGI